MDANHLQNDGGKAKHHNKGNGPLKGATIADGSMTLQLTRLLSRFLAVGVLTSPCCVTVTVAVCVVSAVHRK